MTQAATEALDGVWDFDPAHTRIGFSAKHAMVTTVRGSFNEVAGEIDATMADPSESSVRVRLGVGSIDTRSQQRDDHLRSPDFFDVEQWPEITFVSTNIDQIEENDFAVSGDLTIRDVTRQVMVPITLVGVEKDAFGNVRAGFEGSRRINRRDFGLEWNMPLDSGGVLVSERITLEFEISAIRRGEDERAGAGDGAESADREHPEEA
jgi:polyisoprenoid-binding protein YceI